MKHKHLPLLLIFFLLSLSFLLAQTELSSTEDDAKYLEQGYDIFDKLYAGDLSVASDIDWNVLVFDTDSLGVEFAALKTDAERQEFQTKAITKLSNWLYIDENDGDYYEFAFKKVSNGNYYIYGITEYFDVYLDFTVKNDKLLLTNVSFEEY